MVWKGDYQPFGEPTEYEVYWGNPFNYLANEDDGGLMYFHARYYAKELGRFMSCDPIKDMASSALTINPYVYCGNNPLVFTDPTGLRMAGPLVNPEAGDEDTGHFGGNWISSWSIYSQGAYQGIALTNIAFTQVDALIDSMGLNEDTHQTVFMKDSYGIKPIEKEVFQKYIEEMTLTSVEWVDETRAEMGIDEAHQVHGEIIGSADQAYARGLNEESVNDLIDTGGLAVWRDEYAGSKSFFLYWPTIESRAKQGWNDYWKGMGMESGWFTAGPKSDDVAHIGGFIAMHEIGHIVLECENLPGKEERFSYMWNGWTSQDYKMYYYSDTKIGRPEWLEGWTGYGEAGRYWGFFNPD